MSQVTGKHMAGFFSTCRAGALCAVIVLAGLAALPHAALAQDTRQDARQDTRQDTMVGKDEFIRQLGGAEPTAPAPGGMRLRGVAGVKGMGQTEPVAKEIAVLIHFKYDSVELADDFSRRQVREAGLALSGSELRPFAFEIGGHTDAVGSDAYNLDLSVRRAQAVKDALCRGFHVDCGKLQVRGYGKSAPVASNDDEAGRAQNRRVVFKRME